MGAQRLDGAIPDPDPAKDGTLRKTAPEEFDEDVSVIGLTPEMLADAVRCYREAFHTKPKDQPPA
jgi:hypothetical protein